MRTCIKCETAVSDECNGKTKYCPTHLQDMRDRGWTFSPLGRMKRGKVEVSHPTSSKGNAVVKVRTDYNTRMIALMTGDITIQDLDDEELARGMCRNASGQFPRNEAEMVPRAMYDQMTRELFSRADATLRDGITSATEAIVAMIKDETVDAKIRLSAGQWLFERLRGKVPDVVQVTQEKPFQTVLTHIHRGPRGSINEPDILDAELEPVDDLPLG